MSFNIEENFDYVLAKPYGSDGIIPCIQRSGFCCVGSIGDNFCGGYCGHQEITINGKQMYVVTCQNDLECIDY